MPFAVRNLEAGPAVFSDPTRNIALEWAGADDEDGNDIQQVPDELAQNVNFLRALQKGIFVVEEADEALREALDKQTASWKRRTDEAKAATAATIDPEARNDLISMECIGPSQRAGVNCGTAVLVREKMIGEKPPLCERHKKLAGEYVMTQTDKIVDGKAETKWSRAGMGAREVQQV
jgi:hypothetical protein